MAKRKYTSVDMIRMGLFARDNKNLIGLDLLLEYDKQHPEISEDERQKNAREFAKKIINESENISHWADTICIK